LHQQQRAKAAALRKKKGEIAEEPRALLLPPLAAKPTFTSAKLSSLPDLRSAIKAWHREFYAEGPYGEDVAALAKYLRDVVVEERDLQKAVSAVRWMGWVLEEEGGEGAGGSTAGDGAWAGALERVKKSVQGAFGERGLGRVDLM
jgi:DNA repair protein REV1